MKNCYCGKEIHKDRKYCSFDCRSSDPSYCKKISKTKTNLYNNPLWKLEVEKKKVDTTRENFGVDYPMQDTTIFKKQQASCFKKDSNGLHGYEPFAYKFLSQIYQDILLGTEYMESNNIKIQWIGIDNKSHRSYPDFFIRSINSFIEIKSKYTFSLHEEKLFRCQQELYNMNYGYIICVVEPNKSFQFYTYNEQFIKE